MSKMIRRGDRVVVLSGNDKGKWGEVLRREEERVVIQGVNVRKKHLRRTQETPGGRIVEMEMPVHISKVALCNEEGERLRARIRMGKSGEREIVFGKVGEEVLHRSLKKVGGARRMKGKKV